MTTLLRRASILTLFASIFIACQGPEPVNFSTGTQGADPDSASVNVATTTTTPVPTPDPVTGPVTGPTQPDPSTTTTNSGGASSTCPSTPPPSPNCYCPPSTDLNTTAFVRDVWSESKGSCDYDAWVAFFHQSIPVAHGHINGDEPGRGLMPGTPIAIDHAWHTDTCSYCLYQAFAISPYSLNGALCDVQFSLEISVPGTIIP